MKHEFCDHCPGCRPAMMDERGNVIPDHMPIMIAVNRIWNTQTTYEERKSFIEVTLHNSRDPVQIAEAMAVASRFQREWQKPP